jgi:alkylated DNA repair dioxygenase AlkB
MKQVTKSMIKHEDIEQAELIKNIKSGKIKWGGNSDPKIYGTLQCYSGKRLLKKNRVFFSTELEAIENGYRPCQNCSRNNHILNNDLGIITYQEQFINDVDYYFNYFLNSIIWSHDEAVIYGKKIITKRKIAWFANQDFNYNYSGTSRLAQNWDPIVLEIKQELESQTGYQFNSCLLNLYHDGQEGMAFHSDDQNHLEPNSPVAIISFGAERFFKLRKTSDKITSIKQTLSQGSLLLMLTTTQKYWQHEIPKMAAIKSPRISMTFRSMKKKS